MSAARSPTDVPFAARAGRVAVVVWMLAGSGDLATSIVEHRPGAGLAIAAAAVVLIAALVSSVVGFAFAAIAGSALAYLGIKPIDAVQTMVLCSIAMQTYGVWVIRDGIRWHSLWPLLAAGAVTVPIGVWLLVRVDPIAYAAGLGAFLIVYGAYLLLRRGTPVLNGNVWHDVVAGGLGGITGGLAGIPGPFVTIWCSMRGWDKVRQRAVYQPYILFMQLVTLAWLGSAAQFDGRGWQDLKFVPFALLGAIGGLALFQRMTNKQFQLAVSMLLIASGVGLVARIL
jgi:uncharacterized membrane protein YfcA